MGEHICGDVGVSMEYDLRGSFPVYFLFSKRILESSDFPLVSSFTLCSTKGVSSFPMIPFDLQMTRKCLQIRMELEGDQSGWAGH